MTRYVCEKHMGRMFWGIYRGGHMASCGLATLDIVLHDLRIGVLKR